MVVVARRDDTDGHLFVVANLILLLDSFILLSEKTVFVLKVNVLEAILDCEHRKWVFACRLVCQEKPVSLDCIFVS